MSGTTEAFARAEIDALLQDAGWNLTRDSSGLLECQFYILALDQRQSTRSLLIEFVNDLFQRYRRSRIA